MLETYNRFPSYLFTNYELFLTMDCNYSCKYCIKKSIDELYKVDKYLALSDYDVFSKYHFDYVVISGGETFTDEERLEYIMNVIPRETKVQVLTNGSLAETIEKFLSKYNNLIPVVTVGFNDDKDAHNFGNFREDSRYAMKLLVDPWNVEGLNKIDLSKFRYIGIKSEKYQMKEKNITDADDRASFLASPLAQLLKEDEYLRRKFLTDALFTEYIYGVSCGPLANTLCGHVQCYDTKFTSMNFMDLTKYIETIHNQMKKHTLYPDMAILEIDPNLDINKYAHDEQYAFYKSVMAIDVNESLPMLEMTVDYYGHIRPEAYQKFQIKNFKYYSNAFNLDVNTYFDLSDNDVRIKVGSGKHNIFRVPWDAEFMERFDAEYINDYDLVIVDAYPYAMVGRKAIVRKFLSDPNKYRFPSLINTKLAYSFINTMRVENDTQL